MSDVFDPIYADAYDVLYHDKDYTGECDLIERIFSTYSNGAVHKILDLGCGTGNHAFSLAERGYEVVGVDRSESMIAQAQRKMADPSGNSRVVFEQGDIRSLDLQRRFDSALMMFAVLGYQLENSDVLSALRIARRHLQRGGLLLFDVWYGPAVLRQGPSQRYKVIPTAEGQILRFASGQLDVRRHVCTVHFHVWRFEDERVVAETEENHLVRFFFPLELSLFLESSGLTLVRLGTFPDFDRDPDETTWNVLGVARAV